MFEPQKAIVNPEHDLIVFIGKCGNGKTSLMYHFADEYLKTLGVQRWELSEQIIRKLNAKRKKPLSFPSAPPMYANSKGAKLKAPNGKDFKPIYIEGKDIGISKGKEKYKALFPAPFMIVDEAYKEFKCKGEHLQKGQRAFFNERRHYKIIILLAAPRAVYIHKDIRDSGARVIEVCGQTHERDAFGRICKTTWTCREFRDRSAIEEYINTDGKSGNFIETTYIHNGNIYDIYDSFEYEDNFAPPEGEDFET